MSGTSSHFLKPQQNLFRGGGGMNTGVFWFIFRSIISSPLMHPYNNVYRIVKRFGGDYL